MTHRPDRILTVLALTSMMAAPGVAFSQTRGNARGTTVSTPNWPMRERVSGNMPAYPDEARQRGLGGVITLEATIDQAGHVTTVHGVRSIPMLEAPAVAAVKTWQFKPLPTGTSSPTTQSVVLVFDAATSHVEEARRIGPQGPQPKRTKNIPPASPGGAQRNGPPAQAIFDIVVNTAGKVIDMQVKKSSAGFESVARDAIRQWEYEPLMENGTAVPFVATVTLIVSK